MSLTKVPSTMLNPTAPTIQKFLSTGTTTGYLFTVTSANATVGATYTNNGNTYTVLGTIAASTQLFCSNASAPTGTGTLTKASGTGDATISFSASIPIATYTLPSPAPLYLKISVLGGGGGASGVDTGNANLGSPGTATTFGASLLTCNPGLGGNQGSSGGVGGGFTVNSPAVAVVQMSGNGGSCGVYVAVSGVDSNGGTGGAGPFGGVGPAINFSGPGNSAAANSGSGGSAPGDTTSINTFGGSGGGSGGYVVAYIGSPSATYPYSIGSGGAGGVGNQATGGAGGSGIIIVEEFYQ